MYAGEYQLCIHGGDGETQTRRDENFGVLNACHVSEYEVRCGGACVMECDVCHTEKYESAVGRVRAEF